MKYISICSGIESASVAWHPLGWEPLAFSEIEPFPCAVLAHHWPQVPNLGDMTKYENWTTDIRPNLIVGGTPCQAFSVAGLRKGLADTRGNLTLTFLAILARYRPQWVVWENVPGVLSENTGAFGAFLGGLGELGYGFAYRVLDAQYFGVAQRRRRVFVVAHLGDWRPAAAVLFERESLCGNPAPSREAREDASTDIGAGFTASSFGQYEPGVGTLRSSGGDLGGGSETLAVAARMVAFGEYACDETASTMKMRDHKDATDLVVTTQYGEVAGSLTARHDSSPCADRGQNIVAFSCKDSGNDVGEISPTLRSMNSVHSNQNGGGQVAVAFKFDPLASNSMKSSNPHSGCNQVEVSHCLDTTTPEPSKNQGGIGIVQDFAVRRLTPRECERLQGFPDDHTLIPFRGKPAADGPRYKACGNSMAVPVMAWIGQRIQKIENLMACNKSSLN
jgi:DNA (cytosine-5)-methyltransferase 1